MATPAVGAATWTAVGCSISVRGVPLQQIAADAAAGRSTSSLSEDIQEAHRVMEAKQAAGKIVVVIN